MDRATVDYNVDDYADSEDTKGLYVKFFFLPAVDQAKSAEAGIPVYYEREVVEILGAGGQNNIVVTPVTDRERTRFRRQYELFRQGNADQLIGTPITDVPWLNEHQITDLHYRRIRTLEQLAEINDSDCNVPGMYELRRKARSWVERAKAAAPIDAVNAELAALRAELAELKAAKELPAKAK